VDSKSRSLTDSQRFDSEFAGGTEIPSHQPQGAAGRRPHPPWAILWLGMALPSLVTWVYFVWLAEEASWMQQTAYGIGKGLQFLLPIVAVGIWGDLWRGMMVPGDTASDLGPKESAAVGSENAVESGISVESGIARAWHRLGWMGRPVGGVLAGLLTGSVVAVAMVLLYAAVLLPAGEMETAKFEGQAKLQSIGLSSPIALIAVAVFYSVLHSGFEEFYWRGFVFSGFRTRLSGSLAMLLSSLGFMSHHVLVLAKFFGWNSPKTYLFSFGVAVGGAIWALMVWRSGRLGPAWISHGIVDAAIFLIALHLLFGQ
jgi:uncharacterized protein